MTLESNIEAILFYRASPVKIAELVLILNSSRKLVHEAIAALTKILENRGLSLIQMDDSVMLSTSKSASSVIEPLIQQDLNKDLGKAGLETLTLILYKGPIARTEIDYIRGVNSGYILRTLLIRGLIEKQVSPTDKRTHIYKPTFELLQFMGVTKVDDLPEYSQVKVEFQSFSENLDKQETKVE